MLNPDNLVYRCLKVIHQGLDYQGPPLGLALTSSFICWCVCDTLKSKALTLLCCQSLLNVIFVIVSLNTTSTYYQTAEYQVLLEITKQNCQEQMMSVLLKTVFQIPIQHFTMNESSATLPIKIKKKESFESARNKIKTLPQDRSQVSDDEMGIFF